MKKFLWPWFFVGFLITFVGFALLKTVHYMLRSGDAVAATKLWRFYLNEIPKSFEMQTLGPATVNIDALPRLALSHGVASIIGGLIFAVVAWWLIRWRSKTA